MSAKSAESYSPPNEGGPQSTKERMIIAAERRFALFGIEGTSLRQIAIESEQRNESAAHYHFRSRDGLIRAILAYRIPALNERRERWMSAADHSSADMPFERWLASALIYPMAEHIFSNWRDSYWVRFISQLSAIDTLRQGLKEFETVSPGLFKTYDMLMDIKGIDLRVLAVRRDMLRLEAVWGLARVEAMSFEESREVCELHVANLVDMLAAAIAAPPSQDTLAKVAALPKRG